MVFCMSHVVGDLAGISQTIQIKQSKDQRGSAYEKKYTYTRSKAKKYQEFSRYRVHEYCAVRREWI